MTSSFVAATTVESALSALADGARPIAGGTDLVVGARQGKQELPDSIVSIDRIEELHGITATDGAVSIGALTTHAEIVGEDVIRRRLTAFADASAIVGSHATRAQGTVGGNVMNASPAMELGAPLVVFDASAILASPSGERKLPVEELATGPGTTAADDRELLTRVELSLPPEGTASAYVRLEYRRQMEIAVVGAAAALTVAGGNVVEARVALTALAPTILLVPEAGDALVGTEGDDSAIDEAGRAAAAAAKPISDVRASEEYRRAMAGVVTRRAVAAALARARGETVPVPASRFFFPGGATA